MRISIWGDTSESHLRRASQLGVDCLDFGGGDWFPGVKEQGYPDLDEVVRIRRKIRSRGMDINRVTLPDITEEFMKDRDGAGKELENSCRALRVFAEAGVPIARQRVAGDTFPAVMTRYRSQHRGGYESRGESLAMTRNPPLRRRRKSSISGGKGSASCTVRWCPSPKRPASGWRCTRRTPRTPTPRSEASASTGSSTPFPARSVGYLYCCGTRAEAGGGPLIMDEIHNYGRKGRIFMVHLRNVRGSLATAGRLRGGAPRRRRHQQCSRCCSS